MGAGMRRGVLAAIVCAIAVAAPSAASAATPIQIQSLSPDRYFSPNGDDSEDLARVTYTLTEAADVDVTVKDADGNVVREVLHGDAQAPIWSGNFFEWDGIDSHGNPAPDGVYTYAIRAVSPSAEVATAGGRIGVLRSLIGTMTSPEAGATLAGQATGRFVPTAGYNITRVEFRSQIGESLSVFSIPRAGDGSYTATFDSSATSNGPNRVEARVDWRDAFNQTHFSAAAVPVTVRNLVRIAGITHDAAFSPNGDGVEDTTPTSLYLANDGADVTVRVLDSGHVPVRTLLSVHSDRFVSFTWDGKLADGTPAPDGEYYLEIAATNDVGTSKAERSVTVDTQPVGALLTPAPDHVLTGPETFSFAPRAGLNVYSIHYYASCDNYGGLCAAGYAWQAGLDGTWPAAVDSTQLRDGDITLTTKVDFIDAYGLMHSWPVSAPAKVNNPVRITYTSGDAYFSPDGDGQEDLGEAWFNVTRPAILDVAISAEGGSVVRHLHNLDNPSSYSSFTWDGRDDDGVAVPDGVYSWTMTATDTDGGTATRGARFGVLTTAPGVITAPAAGATFSGPFGAVYQPAAGVHTNSVDFYGCENSGCWVGRAPRPTDAAGPWTGTIDGMDDRVQGAWDLAAYVGWTDGFGLQHTYRTASVPVTIADPLQVTIRGNRGAGDDWFMAPRETFGSRFRVNRDVHATATIVRADGTPVRTLFDEDTGPGNHGVEWDGLGEGHLVTVAPADCPPDPEDPDTVPDCDHWVDGNPLPQGNYELRVHAVTPDGAETTAVQHVRLQRTGGELLTPRDGDTVSRHQAFVFRPAEGLPEPILYVIFCIADTCQTGGWSPDGTYRAALDTTGLPNGPAEVQVSVGFSFMDDEIVQADHWWDTTIAVTISDVAPQVTLVADPAHGDAPLDTVLTLGATDTGEPLDYTLAYGDGTPAAIGRIESPYAPVTLPHTYRDPGVYHAHVSVTDQGGNTALRTIEVVATGVVQPPPTTGTLDVRVATSPVSDAGRFDLSIAGTRVRAGARNGEGTDPQTLTASTYAVAGAAGAATSMNNYDPSVTCLDDHGDVVASAAHAASVSVPVAAGANVVCTMLNTRRTQVLQVQTRGLGAGTITSAPAGLVCDDAGLCTGHFGKGSAVRLTAVPAPGSTFEGWDAAHPCYGTGDCTINLDTNDGVGVFANFDKVELRAIAGEDLHGIQDGATAFDGKASRPASRITRYDWDFGDGQTGAGAHATHVYAEPDTYIATLTVRAGADSATDTVSVVVDPRDDGHGLWVTIRAPGGGTIGGADVVVNGADGDRIQEATDWDGKARLRGLADGSHTVYVNASGYVPAVMPAVVRDGAGSITIDMQPGALAALDVESHQLTQQEIVDAGIDVNDPANQQVYDASVQLCFSASGNCQDVGGYVGNGTGGAWWSAGGTGGGDGGCACVNFPADPVAHTPALEVHGYPVWVDNHPVIMWMALPVGGGFTKQFFEIKALVTNLSPHGISFEAGSATLTLPDGMSLAPTASPQSLTMEVDDIPGGASRGADWTVRGDAAGEYSPSVAYTATLKPFDTPISLSAQTATPLRVWGAGDALRVLVDADSTATAEHPYHVRLGLKNISSGGNAATAYNASLSIGEGGDGYIFQPRQPRSFGIDALAPGDTYWADVILIPERSGVLDVSSSAVAGAAGEAALPGAIVAHEADHALGFNGYSDGTLRWKPVPGATRYEIYSVPAGGEDVFPTEQFPDAPIAQSITTETKIAGGGGDDRWYAVSAIVGNRHVMSHPMVQATLAPDKDDDGVPDDEDNCPSTANPSQADKDDDGKGDACDAHDDRPDPPDGDDDGGDDDDIGGPKQDPNCDGQYHIDIGPVEAIASCWKRDGTHGYKATGRIRVGGLDFVPAGDGEIKVDTRDWEIKTSGTVSVKAGPVTLWQAPLDWTLKAKKTFSVADGAKLKGLSLKGEFSIQLIGGGVKIGVIAGLPGMLGGVTGETELVLTNADGLRFDKLVLKVPGFEIKGKLGVSDAELSYQRGEGGDTWSGGAEILLPRAGLASKGISGKIIITGGELQELSGGIDGLELSLGEGVFLQRLTARIVVNPFGFGGGAGLSFGPQIMGKEAGSLDGKMFLTLEGANKYAAEGKLRIAEMDMASGHASYATTGAFDFGGGVKWEKLGFGLEGDIEGWVDGTRAFNAQGKAEIKAPKLSVGGDAVVSSTGFAACHHASLLPDVGIGYHWGDGTPSIMATSCSIGPWTASRSLARAAAVGTTLDSKLPVATFAITGAGAPPRVTLTGPDGLKVTTPAGGAGLATDRVLLLQNPRDNTTYVAVGRPAGGHWQIDALPGSAAVTGVRHANGLPQPKVTGRVVRAGRRQVLRYTVKPIPGQSVQFAERVPGGRVRVLGKARGSRGSLVIKPEPGSRGKRRVFAQISQYDLPRDELAVTSYAPPKSASGRVTGLRLAVRGGRLRATWHKLRGAKAYRVAVRVSDGRRLLYLDVHRPALTVARIPRGTRVTVQVRADGLLGGKPPVATKSLTARR